MDAELREKILEYVQSGQCPVHLLPIYRWWLQRRPEQVCPDPIPVIFFLKGGRGSGKALDLNTLLPTPIGYIRMGDIEVGDSLFDETGSICNVKEVYDIVPERAWELTFSDHTSIIAGGEHLWATSNIRQRREGNRYNIPIESSVRSTDEIVATLKRSIGKAGPINNHSIALQGPLQTLEAELPIDPWLLGFWLGDGSSHNGDITVADSDLHLLDGLPLGRPNRKPGAKCATYAILGLVTKLRPLGVLSYGGKPRKQRRPETGFKHVPDDYMWASESQRLALLRGLMDSDGYADNRKNTVEFCSIKERLADDVMQLARSLGEKPVKSKGRSKLYGVEHGPRYRVTWCPTVHNPFTLERKAIRLSSSKNQTSRRHHRMITDAVEVSIRPMRCLAVDSPNRMFLAGEQMIPTHNTWAAANHIYEYCVNLPYTSENEIVYVALIGAIFDDIKHTLVEGRSGLLNVIPKENLIAWNRTNGELKWFIQDGDNYREVRANSYTAEKPEKLRGPNTHVAWLDEMAKFKDSDVDPTKAGTTWNNMMLGLRLGTHPHVIVTGTPTPCKLVRYLLNHQSMRMSEMTMEDNAANLPQSFIDEIKAYGVNSRTYRQEAMGEVLFDNPDALFSQEIIDVNRSDGPEDPEDPPFLKVLGYDPSASSAAAADECGIVLCGYTPEVKQATKESGGRPVVIKPTHAYVLKDLSGHYTPGEQTQLVIQTVFNEKVDDLVFEQNQGVEFVMASLEQAIKDNTIEYKIRKHQKSKKTDYGIVKRWFVSGVTSTNEPFKFTIYAIHAVSGKKLRAEMASTRYDSNQVHHPLENSDNIPLPTCPISTCGANLEVQMTSWDPSNTRMSPDRLDAMVYCLLHIFAGFNMTRSKVTIARPPEINQLGSQHEAVKKRVGYAGIYSLDTQSADRLLLPMIMEEDYRRDVV